MSYEIESVRGLEILDSRGFPTVRAFITLKNGTCASASVPSGASTGENEACELRDNNFGRYLGKGVSDALGLLDTKISPALSGIDITDQQLIDSILLGLDGTDNKSKLGSNSMLSVSMAASRLAAQTSGIELYRYLGGTGAKCLPVPMMNVLNGGKHADSSLDFQEFMIVPHGAGSFAEAVRYGSETFQALKKILSKNGYSTAVGDEGGFAPALKSNDHACELIIEAIETAGYKPGVHISIALDPAASSFFKDGKYHLDRSGQGVKSSGEMTCIYEDWVKRFPIISIEDGHDENDWEGFAEFNARLGSKIQIVADDLTVTNPKYIRRAVKEKAANAVLIKLNQIGTVSETMEAVQLCRNNGLNFIISHRSGETEDPFIADFAVAMGGGQIKTGSLCRSERIAKFNRLLEIEAILGKNAYFGIYK